MCKKPTRVAEPGSRRNSVHFLLALGGPGPDFSLGFLCQQEVLEVKELIKECARFQGAAH